MHIDPNSIQLTPEQQQFIALQSERQGKPWPEVLEQLIAPSCIDLQPGESAYDIAQRLGLIGGIRSGRADLSTNPEHMKGFGS